MLDVLPVMSPPMPRVTWGEIGGVRCLVCNAREMHAALGVATPYHAWFAARCARYLFMRGEDYSSVAAGPHHRRGAQRQDHTITLDMAQVLTRCEGRDTDISVWRHLIAARREHDAAAIKYAADRADWEARREIGAARRDADADYPAKKPQVYNPDDWV